MHKAPGRWSPHGARRGGGRMWNVRRCACVLIRSLQVQCTGDVRWRVKSRKEWWQDGKKQRVNAVAQLNDGTPRRRSGHSSLAPSDDQSPNKTAAYWLHQPTPAPTPSAAEKLSCRYRELPAPTWHQSVAALRTLYKPHARTHRLREVQSYNSPHCTDAITGSRSTTPLLYVTVKPRHSSLESRKR